MKIKFIKMKK